MAAGEATTRDGRTLRFERHGHGEPVVVCESGMGLSRNEWGAVVERVSTGTTVVVLNRGTLQAPSDVDEMPPPDDDLGSI